MSELIVSVSGLRGVVGQSLTPEIAARYANAFLNQLQLPGPIVVARDGRASGPALAAILQEAIRAAGRDALDAGVAATPTLGVLVRSLGAAGGLQVSASHNPREYNGIKLFNADGRVVNATVGAEIERQFREQRNGSRTSAVSGQLVKLADTSQEHLDLVLGTVDVEAIRRCRFRVLLDANHGAGSILGSRLLSALGCQATLVGEIPDGDFSHPPEPTAANLADSAAVWADGQYHIIFCQDPDADRLAVIDEQGRYIGEEYTLALVLDHVLPNHQGNVVINCATSRMSADVAQRHGCRCELSAVGEANVVERMIACHAVFGGEGNGGPIDPRVGYVRDSFVGIAQILDLMATRQQPISKLADALPRYQIHKTTIPVERGSVSLLLDRIAQSAVELAPPLPPELAGSGETPSLNRLDGLRLDWPKAWLLVRPSNTEPIVRAIAEAPNLELAQSLCTFAADVARKIGTTIQVSQNPG